MVTVGRTAFWGSYGNIVAAISRPGEREKWFGFLGALRNVGLRARRPGLRRSRSRSAPTRRTPRSSSPTRCRTPSRSGCCWPCRRPARTRPPRRRRAPGATVLRDRPYRLLVVPQLGYSTAMMVLNFALPVYAVTVLGLPGWVTGAVFTINCVMVGFGQGLVVSAMTGAGPLPGAAARPTWSSPRRSCVLLGASRLSVGLATAVVLAGRGRLHAGGAARRPGARRAGRRGGARAPARPLPLADPARLEPHRHDRAGRLRVAARPRGRADLAGAARRGRGRRAARRPPRAGCCRRPRSGSPTGPRSRSPPEVATGP